MNIIPKLNSKQINFLYRHILCILIFGVTYYTIYYYYEDSKTFNSPSNQYTLLDFMYFSLGTQTSVGYGDLYPTHPMTKILVSLQLLSVTALILLTIS